MLEALPLEFDRFHTETLPGWLADGRGALAAGDVAEVAPISFVLPDGRSYHYRSDGRTVTVGLGEASTGVVVELDVEAFSELVHQVRSATALLFASALRFRRGDFDRLVRWEPALRACFAGMPIYDPHSVDLDDGTGTPVDLGRSFTLDDPAEARGDFLRTTGFLHVREVLDAGEIATLRAEVERLADAARPGDDRSWWAKRGDTQVLCRLTYANEHSERIAALGRDPRIRSLGDLAGTELVSAPDRMEGHAVVIKVPGATEGLADLPWHQDCGLGGHPVLCPSVHVGIQLDAATEESGQLHFLAGSHGSSCHQVADDELTSPPHVALTTAPGDCTVHIADVAHAAPPPTGDVSRRTLYVTYYSPTMLEHIGPREAYNDVIRDRRDDGVFEHVDQVQVRR